MFARINSSKWEPKVTVTVLGINNLFTNTNVRTNLTSCKFFTQIHSRPQATPSTEKSGPGVMLQGLIKRITSPARSRSHNRLDTSEGAVSTVHRDDDTGDEG